MSFSSIKSHRKRKVNSSILIIILTLISRINSQSQFWSSNTFNNKHTTASKNPKLFQQQIQKFTSNPYYSQNQMQSKVVKMPQLNQKVFLGLRKPALVKHLEKRYGIASTPKLARKWQWNLSGKKAYGWGTQEAPTKYSWETKMAW